MNQAQVTGDWNPPSLTTALGDAGLTAPAAAAAAGLLLKAAAALGPGGPPTGYFVPGRIEVLGKHTDYAGGRSLICAAQRGFCLALRPRGDAEIRVAAVDRGETVRFALDPDLSPTPGHWSNYPMTVARRLARNFPGLATGAEIAFASNLPPASGMSSSSAMIVASFLALAEVNNLRQRVDYPAEFAEPHVLAGYLGTIENGQSFGRLEGDRGVGTFGGSEDHTAILCAQPGLLAQYAYCPVRFERSVRMPEDCVFAIGSSGVVAEKTGGAQQQYNDAAQLARDVAALWRQRTGRDDPHLAAAIHSGPDSVDRLWAMLSDGALRARFEQFYAENEEILPAAGDALARGQLARFGELVDRSQRGAEQWLGNQIPETIFLAAEARRLGALAASAFGAGFGGSVWALVRKDRAKEFLAAWGGAYAAAWPRHAPLAEFFATATGPAAVELKPPLD